MIKDIISGLSNYERAFRLIFKLKLWKYLLLPGAIGLAIGGTILALAFGLSSYTGDMIANAIHWDFVAKFSTIIGGAIIFLGGLIAFKYLLLIFVSPFMSPLSERVERELYNAAPSKPHTTRENIALIIRGIKLSFRNIIRETFFIVILLLFGMVPVIGLASSVLIFLTHSFYAGYGNLDFTMERRLNLTQSVNHMSAQKGMAIGNGIGFMLLLLIPVVGILLAPPLATIAGTISYNEKYPPPQKELESHEELV